MTQAERVKIESDEAFAPHMDVAVADVAAAALQAVENFETDPNCTQEHCAIIALVCAAKLLAHRRGCEDFYEAAINGPLP